MLIEYAVYRREMCVSDLTNEKRSGGSGAVAQWRSGGVARASDSRLREPGF